MVGALLVVVLLVDEVDEEEPALRVECLEEVVASLKDIGGGALEDVLTSLNSVLEICHVMFCHVMLGHRLWLRDGGVRYINVRRVKARRG